MRALLCNKAMSKVFQQRQRNERKSLKMEWFMKANGFKTYFMVWEL